MFLPFLKRALKSSPVKVSGRGKKIFQLILKEYKVVLNESEQSAKFLQTSAGFHGLPRGHLVTKDLIRS